MSLWRKGSAPFILALALSCRHSSTQTTDAPVVGSTADAFTLVITNAKVYADDAKYLDAVAINGATIASIGVSAELAARCVAPCSVVDANNGFLMPGFHDSHVHLAHAGQEAQELTVTGASLPAIQAAVRAWSLEHPDDTWIQGSGWNAARFSELPTAQDLDAAESGRPVVLRDHGGHNFWVNTRALAAAGITAATPDPPRGRILKDPRTGNPTGILEDSAEGLILKIIPPPTDAELQAYVLKGQALGLAAGCTSSQGSLSGFTDPLAAAKTYVNLDASGRLKQRTFLWAPLDENQIAAWASFANGLAKDSRVQVVAFKGFLDGVVGSRSAALLAPYADDPSTSGNLYMDVDALTPLVVAANQAGFPVALHAIGDRAVRTALDAYERAAKQLGSTGIVNRIEHATIVDPADVPRFAALGVAASIQPSFLYGFEDENDFSYLRRVGQARSGSVFPWRSLKAAGATLSFGSDMPAGSTYDPVSGLYTAIFRRFLGGDAFTPDEVLDPTTSMNAYTVGPALLAGVQDRLGKIAPGYLADLVVLDHDPTTGAKSLVDDPVRRMWIAGEEVTALVTSDGGAL
jgi:predicted amidohydrolase YtcJ